MLVIVPAWNEEESLPTVVAEIREALPAADVLVVNDGSADGTARVAEQAGVLVANLSINLGVGAAMRTGYRYASRNGYAVAIQIDGDGQHNPHDVPALLALLDDGANIAIGARVPGDGAYTAKGPRLWAMKLLSSVISRIAHTPLTDTTSGFKACDGQAIDLFAQNYPAEYLGDTVESLVVAARSHLVIREVGVHMRSRAGGAPSHNPLRSAVFLGRAVMALMLALTRPRPSRRNEGRYEELGA